MNSVTTRRWELKLGVIQTIALLGGIFGGLACTFYLGYSAGRTTGHEQALAASLAAAPKVSLRPEVSTSEHAVSSKDIFAKLDTQRIDEEEDLPQAVHEKSAAEAAIAKNAPEVASIPVAEVPDEKPSEPAAREHALGDLALEEEPPSRVAGKTLADLAVPEKNQEVSKKSEIHTAEVQNTHIETSPKVQIPIEKEELKPLSDTSVSKTVEKPPLRVEALEKIPGETEKPAPTARPTMEPKKEAKLAEIKEVKKVEPPKVEKPSAQVNSGWFAQVAAPQELSDAQSIVSKLRSSGFKASIENATVRGESYYRILVGPEENRGQAERLIQQLGRESYLKGAPFLRFIK